MSATIRELRPVENTPEPEMVQRAEELLERIKSGEVVAVAIVTHNRGGGIGASSWISKDGDGAHLVCALERLKIRILKD